MWLGRPHQAVGLKVISCFSLYVCRVGCVVAPHSHTPHTHDPRTEGSFIASRSNYMQYQVMNSRNSWALQWNPVAANVLTACGVICFFVPGFQYVRGSTEGIPLEAE